MSRLLVSTFIRMLKKVIFWFFVLCMFAYGVYTALNIASEARIEFVLDRCLFECLPLMGLISAIFTSLFIGSEYSDGTIRNKIIVGHSRIRIYLANLIVCAIASVLIHQKLGEPKLYDNYVTVNEMGIPTQVEQLPNPQYIEGTPRIVLEVLSDLLPSGQAIQLADAFDTEGMTDESIAKAPYRWMGYSLLVTFLTSVLGIALFQKKEIR